MIEWNQRLQKIARPTKSTEAILFLNEQPRAAPIIRYKHFVIENSNGRRSE